MSFPLGILAVLLVALQAPTTRPASRPSKPVDPFTMSPHEFAQSELGQRELLWDEIDDRLMSAAILHETNRHRVEHKLPPVRHMPKIDEAAIMHAVDMSQGGWFSHVNPDDPKRREVIDRVKLLKLRPMFAGENIIMEYGYRYEPGREVFDITRDGKPSISYAPDGEPLPNHTYHSFAKRIVQRWMDSPPHRENMLSPHPKFLGSACRQGKKPDEVRFHKWYCAQVFFAPMPR